VRVVIADDSALLREGLARLLGRSGIEVCATAADAPALVQAVRRERRTIAVVDIRMPPTYTHEGAERRWRCARSCRTSAYSCSPRPVETHFASQLLERPRGAVRLPAQGPGDRRHHADRRAAHDRGRGTVLDPEIVRHLMRRDSAADPLASLTEVERDVLALMAEGRSNSAIADRLTVTLKTVESHIANILQQAGPARRAGRPPSGARGAAALKS
jgi:DNA-binding NarL/FixJ family response regulator